MIFFQTEIKSEREESPIVTPIEEEDQMSLETEPKNLPKESYQEEKLKKGPGESQPYPEAEELFNLTTLADVSLAYAGQLHTQALTEQINQAR